ncbi:hypothetical protein GE09DRAFT_1162618 [Coniochaeta sp. 2T2.1]|nr:hypothetical protein GE09DRAFT_1162618 [Coniochaeta sp. 2T2.1]
MALPPLPQTMRQLLQPSLTSPTLILTTAPIPTSGPDEALIRISACSPCKDELIWALNPASPAASGKEAVPCLDFAGTVVSAPAGSEFAAGDHVFGAIDPSRAGAAREFAVVKTGELARLPGRMGWDEAAATPLSALTAWQAVFVQGGLEVGGLKGRVDDEEGARERNRGKRVLVTGAAGGVGSWAVQFAALAGARVVGVCGAGKEGIVRELGAGEVVDYTRTSVEEWVAEDKGSEVDLVVDCVGGKALEGAWRAVKDGGSIVSVYCEPETVRPAGLEKVLSKSLFFILETSGAQLGEIAKLLEAGKARPLVDSVWPLDEFEKAFERLDSGRARGKVVIKIRD